MRSQAGATRHVWLYLILVVLSVAAGISLHVISSASAGQQADRLPLEHVADIALPGRATRLDYMSYDASRHLLFIAHLGDSEVIAFDTLKSRVVSRVSGIASVHGVLAVPELGRVYASATGTNEIVAIDEASMQEVARAPAGVYPDGIAFEPASRKLYVSDETGGTLTVIDTHTNRRTVTIQLGGEAGNTQYDPASHHIFVNVQTRRQLDEIDPSTDTIVSRIDLPEARGNHGLAIAPQLNRAFIACEDNNRLLVLDMLTRRVTQSFDVGGEPDVLAYDPGLRVLYVAGEKGIVSMFRVSESAASRIGEGFVGPNAHVVGVDAATHRTYFPLKNVDGRPVLRIMALSPTEAW
ncbi:YncE family protein [Paraburkholderia sp. UYCP14C]|uniref:YncE family protein n=1 Tax=Paraburkholderia sp. UYCP14C TaxID=2511130 RepID=UPI00101EEDD3|nr:YncE family protein [Paraburkholderia sp. UYCP14C]RZF29174.1 YncE family protein [Paraburkholderia sp. UYCP14C]